MLREKITRPARKIVASRIASPVIIRAVPDRLRDVVEEIRPYVEEIRRLLPRLAAPVIPPFTPYPMRIIPRFRMVATILPREVIWALAESPNVERIYHDQVMYAFFPTVPPEGVFEAYHPIRKRMRFTSTHWTRRLIGAEKANEKGFMGRGILVSVLDSGASRVHEQIRRVEFETTIAGWRDENGHGCIEPGAYVFTSSCGVETIERVYSILASRYGEIEGAFGKTVIPREEIYTIGYRDGRAVKTRILAVHKIPIKGRVVEVKATGSSRFLTTTWHPFLVYDYRYGRPKYVKAERLNCRVHVLVRPDRFVELGDLEIDPKLAYVIGFFIGDGHLPIDPRSQVSLYFGEEIPERFLELLRELGYSYSVYRRRTGKRVDVYGGLRKRLIDYGFRPGAKALTVEIPKSLLLSRREAILALLAGIVDSDGHFDKNRARVRIITHSRRLANQLVTLLSAFGLDVRLSEYGKVGRVHKIKGYEIIDRSRTCSVSVIGNSYYRLIRWLSPYLIIKAPRYHGRARPHDRCWVMEKNIVNYDGYFYDFTTETGNYLAGRGGLCFIHNTHVATTVGGLRMRDEYLSLRAGREVFCEGMAPDCALLAVKCLGYYVGMGSTSNIIEAIDLSIERGAQVLNLSLGGPSETTVPQDDPYYVVMEETVRYGVIPVVAAGNEGPSERTVSTPGAMPQVLTVGAFDPITGRISAFSSRGPTLWDDIKPDVVAPGAEVDSGLVGVLDASGDGAFSRYSPLSGTSMATPHVAGLVALMVECHRRVLGRALTVEEVKRMMAELGMEKTPTYGWGAISWDIYERWIESEYGVELR